MTDVVRVKVKANKQVTSLPRQSQILKNRLLSVEQCIQSLARQAKHRLELVFVKDMVLRRGLYLHEFVTGGHDKVHVHIRPRVLFIAEIEKRFAVNNADAHRRDEIS